MTSTPNMGLVLPDVGGSTGTWGSILNTLLGLVDAHDHTTGKGVQVPSAGLKINADVSWSFGGTHYAITDAQAVDFTPTATGTVTSYSSALFVNSADNNLYFRNSSGTNVQVTSGSTLNISIVGGIGGDYASVGALFSFDDATDSYWAQQQGSPRPWARLRVGDVDIYETAASIVNRVRLKSPGALAASYDVTWPAAVPGTQAMLQMSTAGVLSVSNTLAQTMSFGNIKETVGFEWVYAASDWVDGHGSHTKAFGATSGAHNRWTIAASANVLNIPINFRDAAAVGFRITGYTIFVQKNTNNTNTIAAKIYEVSQATGTITNETALSAGSSNAGNAPGAVTLSESGLAINTNSAQFSYYLVFTPGGGATPTNDVLLGAIVTGVNT